MDTPLRAKVNLELLDKQLSGEVLPGSPEDAKLVQAARQMGGMPTVDASIRWAGIRDRLRNSALSEPRRTRSTWRYLTAAAGVAICAAGIKYLSANSSSDSSFIAHTYTTVPGQRANVQLAPGSRVIIGPATTLKIVEAKSPKGSITADINGEALFIIEHSASHPFTVTSHGVTTRVLGTQFVVRAYDASYIRVAVREGRVSVHSPAASDANTVMLGTGSAATVASAGLPVVTEVNDIATDFAWAGGQLVLRDVPLGEALARLSRWYGIQFRVDDPSMLGLDVDMTFPSRFSQEHLQLFADVLGASIQKSGSTITILRKR